MATFFGVYSRLMNADGTAAQPVQQVNQTTDGIQSGGEPALLQDGGYVITWQSRSVDGSFYAVMSRAYNADGTPRGNEVRVNQTTSGSQDTPDITVLTDGRYVIVCESGDQDGSGDGVYGRIYNADGTPTTGEFRVNSSTLGDQGNATIAPTPDGGFVVVWQHEVCSSQFELRS